MTTTTATMMKKAPISVAFKGADDSGQIELVFATLNVIDKDGDVTLAGAFTEGAPVVMSAYGHKSWEGDLPIGAGTIHEEGDEAVMRGQFFVDTAHGLDAYRTVKALSERGLQEWSYSLEDVIAKRGEMNGQPVNFLESIYVKEVSPVLVGAGVNTHTRTVKGAMKFSEQVDAVLADVADLEERAARIMALRATKGKSIAAVSAAAIDRLVEAVTRLKDTTTSTVDPNTPPPLDALAVEYLRFVEATNQERFHP